MLFVLQLPTKHLVNLNAEVIYELLFLGSVLGAVIVDFVGILLMVSILLHSFILFS